MGKNINTNTNTNKLYSIDLSETISEFNNNESKFFFIPKLDQINYDLYRKIEPLHELFKIALNDPDVIAFNSLGFFKNKIEFLDKSQYFKENQGIYIKKSYYNNNNIRIFYQFDETTCKNVSSRGILKLCDIKSNNPISSINFLLDYNLDKVKDGNIIYVCNNALHDFINILPTINNRIVLVSGDADETIPDDIFNYEEFIKFIESDKIIHWFSQNCVISHPKVTSIPIGLDYHTLARANHEWGEKITPFDQEVQLNQIKNNSKPFYERLIKCYSNFHFFTTSKFGYDRIDAIEKIPADLVFYEPIKIKRFQSWKNQSEYAFVISPHGNGLDCHRTWEALALGCIPIVKKSLIDILYDNLPVLIVNEWNEVSYDLLISTVEKFKNMNFDYKKLELDYWKERITKVTNQVLFS